MHLLALGEAGIREVQSPMGPSSVPTPHRAWVPDWPSAALPPPGPLITSWDTALLWGKPAAFTGVGSSCVYFDYFQNSQSHVVRRWRSCLKTL